MTVDIDNSRRHPLAPGVDLHGVGRYRDAAANGGDLSVADHNGSVLEFDPRAGEHRRMQQGRRHRRRGDVRRWKRVGHELRIQARGERRQRSLGGGVRMRRCRRVRRRGAAAYQCHGQRGGRAACETNQMRSDCLHERPVPGWDARRCVIRRQFVQLHLHVPEPGRVECSPNVVRRGHGRGGRTRLLLPGAG